MVSFDLLMEKCCTACLMSSIASVTKRYGWEGKQNYPLGDGVYWAIEHPLHGKALAQNQR